MAAPFPDPDQLYPMPEHPSVMFVRNLPNLPPNVDIGEFTYYDDAAGPDAFGVNILYHFEFTGDRLRIGRSARPTSTRSRRSRLRIRARLRSQDPATSVSWRRRRHPASTTPRWSMRTMPRADLPAPTCRNAARGAA